MSLLQINKLLRHKVDVTESIKNQFVSNIL
jgi:hypothetical protein